MKSKTQGNLSFLKGGTSYAGIQDKRDKDLMNVCPSSTFHSVTGFHLFY